MSKSPFYYMDVGGLGSQADADRKKKELAAKREHQQRAAEFGKQGQHRRKVEKSWEQMLRELREANAVAFQNKELLERLMEELRGGDELKAGDAVNVPWEVRMCEQEKLDREALWIPLNMVVVTKLMVESQFKMLAKHVHPDQNPGIGDEEFIALKSARERMLKRAVS